MAKTTRKNTRTVRKASATKRTARRQSPAKKILAALDRIEAKLETKVA